MYLKNTNARIETSSARIMLEISADGQRLGEPINASSAGPVSRQDLARNRAWRLAHFWCRDTATKRRPKSRAALWAGGHRAPLRYFSRAHGNSAAGNCAA